MKIQLLFLIAVIWLFPSNGQAYLCYGPGRDYIYSDICKDSSAPADICTKAGYKLNKVTSVYVYCMDKNCLLGQGDTGCQLCSSDRMYVKGQTCAACPSNAICDGQNIVGCPSGMFMNGSQCSACDSSCQTCSGAKSSQCTSCNSGRYLSNGSCLSCPANATCSGSSTFTCNSGYSEADGECVKNEQEPTKTNTVNSCPSRMTLSSDGCCCINK